jgi:hypothetical protein
VVRMTLSRRLHRSQVEYERVDAMGYVRPCYTCFAVFILLSPMSIAVI